MASQLLPFANEIANVLTESGVLLFKGVYQAAPTKTGPIISKTIIDFLALAGIVAGSIEVAELEGPKAGTVHGALVLFAAFVVPNLTFHALTNKFCKRVKCNPAIKIAFGFFLIALLVVLEKTVIKKIVGNFAEHDDEETHEE